MQIQSKKMTNELNKLKQKKCEHCIKFNNWLKCEKASKGVCFNWEYFQAIEDVREIIHERITFIEKSGYHTGSLFRLRELVRLVGECEK